MHKKIFYLSLLFVSVTSLCYSISITNLRIEPSPFDPRYGPATITYTLDAAATGGVDVEIYSGATRVRVIPSTSSSLGVNYVYWDGKNDSGATVPVGDYTVKVIARATQTSWTGTVTKYAAASQGIAINKRQGSQHFGKIYVAHRTTNNITDGTTADGGGYAWENSTWTKKSEYPNGGVTIYTLQGSTPVSSGEFARPSPSWDDFGPVRVNIDDEDYVYVSDWWQFGYPATFVPQGKQKDIRIWRFNPDGTSPIEVLSYTSNGMPETTCGFRVKGSGNNKSIYLVARTKNSIYKYTTNNGVRWTSTSPEEVIPLGESQSAPADLCLDSSNNIYVCFGDVFGSGTVSFSPSSTAVAKYSFVNSTWTVVWRKTFDDIGGLKSDHYGVTAIDYSSKDNLIYFNNGGYIGVISPDGTVIDASSWNSFGASDCKADADGQIYIVSYSSWTDAVNKKGSWWKIRTASTTMQSADATVNVSVQMLGEPLKKDKIKVTMSPPGQQDSVYGEAGCGTAGATVKVYSDSELKNLIGQQIIKDDGSFDSINIGDNQYSRVYLTQTPQGGSKSMAVYVDNDIEPPNTAPASLTVKLPLTGTGLVLEWAQDSNAEKYNVYRDVKPFVNVTGLTPIAQNITGLTYTDTSIPKGEMCYYGITSVDAAGNENKLKTSPISSCIVVDSSVAKTLSSQFISLVIENGDIVDEPLLLQISTSVANTTAINNANNNAMSDPNISLPPEMIPYLRYCEITFKDRNNNIVTSPCAAGKTLVVEMEYSDEQVNVDPSLESTFRLYKLNAANNLWEYVPSNVDTERNKVTGELSSFSIFTVLPYSQAGQGPTITEPTNLKSIKPYPNPYRESLSTDKALKFNKVPKNFELKIYHPITGELVFEDKVTNGQTEKTEYAEYDAINFIYKWKLKDKNGEDILPGVYLCIFKTATEKKSVKIAIIR
jgi:hypothetical protein